MDNSDFYFERKKSSVFNYLLIIVITALATWAVITFWGDSKSGRFSGSSSGGKLGLVRIEGLIADVEKAVDWIEELKEDDSVKGVLLRINSGGGGVAASQELARAVEELAKVKPVVASMGSVAASGAYYAASQAGTIVANPGTLTGSIGVKFEMTNLEGLMDKLGLKHQSLVSGKYKDAGSPFRQMTEADKEYLQSVIMDMHEQFVKDVARGRKMPPEKMKAFADGRVMTGSKALEYGLVDKLGTMEDAFRVLKKLCGMPEKEKVPVKEGPKKERPWWLEAVALLDLNPAERFQGPKWEFSY